MVWLHLHTLLSKQGRKEELWGDLQKEKQVNSSEVLMAPPPSEEKAIKILAKYSGFCVQICLSFPQFLALLMEREEDLMLRAASCAVSAIGLQLAVACVGHCGMPASSSPLVVGAGEHLFAPWENGTGTHVF